MKSTTALLCGLTAASACLIASPALAEGAIDPAAVYEMKCVSCHAYGKGAQVGPDLKGVTERRSRPWLIAWIRSSEKVIRSGDPTAVTLFQQYRRQRMPDHDLTDTQISALLDYLADGGPERSGRPEVVHAVTAGPAELKRGSDLFYGAATLKSGGLSCASCHALTGQQRLGANLGPDLVNVYSRYRDRPLHDRLEQPCVPGNPALTSPKRVEADESLALRAFFRAVDVETARAEIRDLKERLSAAATDGQRATAQ